SYGEQEPIAAHAAAQPPQAPKGSISFPPGNVGEVAKAIYNMAPRPVPEVAIAGALGLMAGICGKAYATPDDPSGLNLFVLLTARSAIGKNAMHSGIAYLMKDVNQIVYREKGPALGIGSDFITREESASSPALAKAL